MTKQKIKLLKTLLK